MEKYIYSFEEGNKDMKESLGGKGANLAEMTNLEIPVPPGFIISTEACEVYSNNNKELTSNILEEIESKLIELEQKTGKKLGDNEDPLLVSVRSGAAVSMPGMMDTVLNLGLNDQSVLGLANKTNNERFAWDSYRRFMQMFGDVVMGVNHHHFEKILTEIKQSKSYNYDTDLNVEDLKLLVSKYKVMVQEKTEKQFPQDGREQLTLSVNAVFDSWNNSRAILYRQLNNISGLKGTAVNVQTMVFGNMGETSGTGVCFTRDPATGENIFYGEYLMNAQGEDVVAGTRTPQRMETLNQQNPQVYTQLVQIREKLEQHFKDMQDMEFTIQEGKLYILQTRSGKRTAAAAVRCAVEMLDENLIDEKTAILRVDPNQLNQLLHKQLDPEEKNKMQALTTGLPASPGAAVGEIVFDAHKADELNAAGKTVVLVRTETSPEDLIGMNAAQGILTSRGGMTSHAAVVARGMGKCCVAGAHEVIVDEEAGTCTINDKVFKELDWITLDGSEGKVYEGKIATTDPELSGYFGKLMELADKHRRLKVRTNAETPRDAAVAIKFGAQGIGLCRTEHMFFEGDRINVMREMILAKNEEGRREALSRLLPMQQKDFKDLFDIMEGLPVTIRLLDPPLHEFLPKDEEDMKEISSRMDISIEKLKEKIESLHEENPMLGHRGCRLMVTYPEIVEMQTEAIIKAAVEIKSSGKDIVPEIMVPLIGNVKEYTFVKKIVEKKAKEVLQEAGVEMQYLIGTMIEVPRAALTADEVAKEAEFFSFGTNDLTQMTLGFSRDDVGSFVPEYVKQNILEVDPFEVLDQTGVGQLVKIAVEKGKSVNPKIKLGICGEHGGEPKSVEYCHKVGLNYVSCSPFRVPIARLAAAQAVLKEQ
jgi:pyruvate, orthophosphate dikinase